MASASRILFVVCISLTMGAPAQAAGKDHVLWDAWYTVSIDTSPKKIFKYAYYNDKVTVKGDKIFYQNQFWKNEEGYLNRESLGAFASDTSGLTPLFFNFRSVYRNTETKIDGTARKGVLTVKATRGGKDIPVVERGLDKGEIFSVFFPLWLKNEMPEMKEGDSHSFSTVLEDNLDLQFQNVPGLVRLDKPDDFARKTKTSKFIVDYRDIRSYWYVRTDGVMIRIDMPTQKSRVEKVTREQAEHFIDLTDQAPSKSLGN